MHYIKRRDDDDDDTIPLRSYMHLLIKVMRVDWEDLKLLVSDVPLNTSANRAWTAEVMFEKFKVGGGSTE